MAALVPPNDLDAEAAVLSAVLLEGSLDRVRDRVAAQDFYADANRKIFAAALELDGAGKPCDLVTVGGLLRDHQRLGQVGGPAYLAQIVDSTPAFAHVSEHARIVRDKARIRRVQDVARVIAAEGYGDTGDVSEWLQGVEARLFRVTGERTDEDSLVTFSELAKSELKRMTERRREKVRVGGLATGFPTLDRKLDGLKRGNKYTVAGRPGTGKTAFALALAINLGRHGLPVVFFSLEMPREQLTERAIAQESKLSTQRVARSDLNDREWAAVARAFSTIASLPIVIDDRGTQTLASVRSSVRRALTRLEQQSGKPAKLALVVVDYLQIMTPLEKKGRSRENEVSDLSAGLRALAREFNCAVLELSQLSRECERRQDKRPILSDLRDSGAIEQDAFGILMLYRDDLYKAEGKEPDHRIEILIRKLRQGGGLGTVKLHFDAESTSFHEFAEDFGSEFDSDADDWKSQAAGDR